MERMNKEELVKLIGSLKIDKDEFWILSSGALVIRGIWPDAGDLDIAVTKKGFEQLKENYDVRPKENGFYIVSDRVECTIDTMEDYKVEKVDGYNLQSINEYYKFLKNSKREKDKGRIEIVEKYMKER